MTVMENDLKSEIDSILDRLQVDHHVTDIGRLSLQRWFVEKLETERRGWKGRLKDAARAADGEHRQTLTAHATIQQVIGRMVNRLPVTSSVEAATESRLSPLSYTVDYSGSSDVTDRKSSRLVQLEQYWEAVDRYIDHLESERAGCLRVLGISDDTGDDTAGVVDLRSVLQNRLGDVEKETARKTLVASLTAENGEMRDRLRVVVRSERLAADRHEREVSDLKKTVTALEQQILKQTELIESLSEAAITTEHVDVAVQTDIIRRVPPTNRAQPTVALRSTASMVTDQLMPRDIVKHVRTSETAGQTLRAEQSVTSSTGSTILPLITQQQQQQQYQPHQQQNVSQVSGDSSLPAIRTGEQLHRKYSIFTQQQQQQQNDGVSRDMGNKTVNSNSLVTSNVTMATTPAVSSQTTAVVFPNIVTTTTSSDVMSAAGSERLEWKTYSPSYLRGQVLSFASKLEETKRDMDACQRELVRLKATVAFGNSHGDFDRDKQSNDDARKRNDDVIKKQRHQRQVLAAKSVTTLHLPPVDQSSTSPRSLHDNESSRTTESTWRVADIDNDLHYASYARRHRHSNKHWRT